MGSRATCGSCRAETAQHECASASYLSATKLPNTCQGRDSGGALRGTSAAVHFLVLYQQQNSTLLKAQQNAVSWSLTV